MKKRAGLPLLAAFFLLLPLAARAAVPMQLNYQGKLADSFGNPLTGTYSFRFKLYTVSTGGTPVFSEDVTGANAIGVVNGIYTYQIGSLTAGGVPAGVFDPGQLYLEIDVAGGSSLATAETLSPRERIVSVASAIHALEAEKLGYGALVSTYDATTGNLALAGNLVSPYGLVGSTHTFVPQATVPAGVLGEVYFDQAIGLLRVFTTSGWVNISTGTAGLPADMMTTDTYQNVTATKNFQAGLIVSTLTVTSTATVLGRDLAGFSLALSSGLNAPNGTILGGMFAGNGANLTNVTASQLAPGLIVPTANGGTGANLSTQTANSLPYFGSSGFMTALGPGAAGFMLQANGPGAAPTWVPAPTGANLLNSTNTWTAPNTFTAPLTVVSTETILGQDNLGFSLKLSSGLVASSGTIVASLFEGTFAGNGSGLSGVGSALTVPASGVLPGALGASVIASSIAAGAIGQSDLFAAGVVNNAALASGLDLTKFSTGTLAANLVGPGVLGPQVIASSIGVSAVYPAALQPGTYNISITGASGSALVANQVPAAGVQAGALGPGVVASSIAAGAISDPSLFAPGVVTNAALGTGLDLTKFSTGTLAANLIAPGALGPSVIASSIAVGAVQDASIVGISGAKVAGNIPGDAANITGSLSPAQIAAGALPANVVASSLAVNAVTPSAVSAGTYGSITLPAANLTGQVATANGGTGQNFAAAAQGAVPVFTGVGVMGALLPSTSGYLLETNGAGAAPSWVPAPNGSALLNSTNTWTAPNTFTAPLTVVSTETILGQDSLGFSLKLSSGLTMPAGTIVAGLFEGNGAGLTNVGSALTANQVPAAGVLPGALGPSVIASSIAVAAISQSNLFAPGVVDNNALGTGLDLSKFTAGTLAANLIGPGTLGPAVIASSIGVNAVQDASIVGVSGAKVAGNIPGNAANVTGIVAAANGGTGANLSTETANSLPYFGATGVLTALGPGSAGYMLQANGGGTAPSWVPAPNGSALLNSSNTWTANQTFANPITLLSTETVLGQDASGYSLKLSSGLTMPAGTIVAGLFEGNGAGLTNVGSALTANQVPAAGVLPGALGPSVLASSIAANAVTPSAVSAGTYGSITLPAANLAGQVSAANGGTGANLSTETANAVPYFGSAGVLTALAPGSAGYILQTNGAGAAPTWVPAPTVATLLNSTNTWTAPQTFLEVVAVSTDLYMPAGQINLQGNRVTTAGGKLDASQLANTVPLASLSGITSAELSASAGITGGQIAGGSLTNANMAAGTFGSVSIPAANVNAGALGSSVIASSIAVGAVQDASIVSVSGAKVAGNIPGSAANVTGIVAAANGGTGANLSTETANSLPYFGTPGVLTALGPGTAGQILQTNGPGSAPSWVPQLTTTTALAALLTTTNTWSAQQTFLNQITVSTTVYLPAGGQLNAQGHNLLTGAGLLDASKLSGLVPPANGGTGADLSGTGALGGLPYFTGSGVMGAVPAGTSGFVLQSNGAAAPSWVALSGVTAGDATNLAGGSAGVVPYQSAANATAFTSVGTPGQVLQSGGTGSPTWTSAPTFSTLTVTGSAFSVGGSTLVVAGGNVGIGTASPDNVLQVANYIDFGNGNSATFIGQNAGHVNSGNANTFIGALAGQSNTFGGRNAFVGYNAGGGNTSGNYNSYLGYNAGAAGASGSYDTFIGYAIGGGNGSYNTFLGAGAGGSTSGSSNTVTGYNAGSAQTSSIGNSLYGYQAGFSLTSGGSNVLLGSGAGYSLTTGANNIIIGANQDVPSAGRSNYLNVGGVLYGDLGAGNVGVGTGSPLSRLDVNGGVAVGSFAGTTAAPGNGMIISGSVGIGTGTPSAPLEVNGQANVTNLRITGAGVQEDIFENTDSGQFNLALGGYSGIELFAGKNGGPGPIRFFTGGPASTEWMRVDTGGNVGIGTASPLTLLDVNGTAQFGQGAAKSTFTATGALQLSTALASQYGGTGANLSTETANSLPYFGSAGVLTALAPGSVGTILQANGAGLPPAWVSLSSVAAQFLNSTNTWTANQYFYNELVLGSTETIYGQDASGYSLKLSSGLEMPNGTLVAGMFSGNGAELTNVEAVSVPAAGVLAGTLGPNVAASSVAASLVIPSMNGGTGANLSTETANSLPYFGSTGVLTALGPGTAGYVLQANGPGSAPTWASAPGATALLNSTNTWTAPQTFLEEVTVSTDLFLSGQLNALGNRLTTAGGKLDANQLANVVAAANGGTGANLSTQTVGALPIFGNGGVIVGLGAGVPGYVLQTNGPLLPPTWVASPGAGLLLSSTDTWTAEQTFEAPVTVTSTLTVTGQDSLGYSLKLSSGINMPFGTVNAGLFMGSGAGLSNVTAVQVPAGGVLPGLLGPTVIASSVAVNAVTSSQLAFDPASLARISNSTMTLTGASLTIDPSVNVGIGTTNPTAKLEVASPGGSKMQLDTSNAGYASLIIDGVEVARIHK